jgi:hypothetical protein
MVLSALRVIGGMNEALANDGIRGINDADQSV